MRAIVFVFAAVLMLACFKQASAQDSIFTYQGELSDSGEPAQGAYDLAFSLWDASENGAQVGGIINLPGVTVTDGLFTVELDFGEEVFDNSGRWLQISVNNVTLTSRQRISRSPYAIQTRGIFVDASKNVGIGTTDPQARLDVAGPVTLAGPVTINHNSPTEPLDVDGSILARGRLLSGYPFRFFWADPDQEFVGIGRTTQVSAFEVLGTYQNTDFFSGMYIQTGAAGEPFYGYSAGGDIDAYHFFDGDDPSWKLNMQNTTRIRVDAATGETKFTGNLDVTGDTRLANDLVVLGTAEFGIDIDIGYHIAQNSQTSNGGSESVGATCSSGKVLGGGCFGAGNNDTLDTSSPSGDNGWNCFWSDTDNGFTYIARAICANVR